MNTIEKIRAEIERLKGQLIRGACAAQIEMETNCKDKAYNEVLSFLDTLEEEPVDLEKELKELCDGTMSLTSMDIARHFYELGLNGRNAK